MVRSKGDIDGRDFAGEIANLEAQLEQVNKELAQYEWQRDQLVPRTAEIVRVAGELGVTPKIEAVKAEMERISTSLAQELDSLMAGLSRTNRS